MASILLGCAAVISPRVRERRRAKVEREREYADNFAALQEENEKRVKRLSILSAAAAVEQQQNEGGCLPHQRPPGG
ncbi:hypothetical protein SLS58_010616 [Diplodia intermedia]|uniref:Uncharacterized protein n=1 Tax=Diplodia intermedia TaxID=856260 RepID=A0ABR3T629_9PEZI